MRPHAEGLGAVYWISPTPVKVNGHFCDVFEGMHLIVGRVALKRPRTGAAGYNEDVIRVRVLSITIFSSNGRIPTKEVPTRG